MERDGRLVLKDGDEIDELTVYADAHSCGQVVVESGLARVDKPVLKYTFTPGEWNFVSFPADASLSRISNLDALGYRLNDGQKAFYLCEYDTHRRAGQPGGDMWTRLQTDNVARNKGYIMSLSPSADNPGDKPVEVTFVLGNTTLGVDASGNGSMNVELNMMQLEPGTEFPVYVMPDGGVKGARGRPRDLQPQQLGHTPHAVHAGAGQGGDIRQQGAHGEGRQVRVAIPYRHNRPGARQLPALHTIRQRDGHKAT